jgi:hypothetical protein
MIKINLLKSEQPRQPLTALSEGKPQSRKLVMSVGLIALLGAGAFFAYDRFGGGSASGNAVAAGETPEGASAPVAAEALPEVPKLATETPPEPPVQKAAAPPSGEAVEDIVGELARQAEAAPKPRGYADLVPSERVEYQLQAVLRLLKDIKGITPPDVGFAEFVFTPPGEFYVHGLAYDPQSLERFEQGLRGLQGAEVRPGKMKDVGSAKQKAREFSYYCKVSYPVATLPTQDRVVERNKVDGALRDAVALGQSLGLKLKTPKLTGREDAGAVQRLVFATTADASYDKLADFLEQMRAKQAPLGVLRVSLKARGDEDMVADLDLVAYVGQNPGI